MAAKIPQTSDSLIARLKRLLGELKLERSYGWVMIGIAALAMLATLPGRTMGLGMVTERLLADEAFGIDKVTYGDINLWGTLLGALFCLPCGRLIDRFGLRITLTATVLALAIPVLWMTRLTGREPFFFAILLTRGFGQSALSVVSITIVGKWYRDRLSVAMAYYSLLVALLFAGAFQLAKPFAVSDWRLVWDTIGWSLAGFAVVAWVLTREPPVRSDKSGADMRPEFEPATHQAVEGFTLPQALATPAFWVFGFCISLVALVQSGLSLFNESVLTQQGFAPTVFYDVVSVGALVGLAVKLPVGSLARYVSLGKLYAAALLLKAVCLFVLPSITTYSGVMAYAMGTGAAGTITTLLFFTIYGHCYGRAHLGQIQAVAQMLTVVASASGPKLFAECFARTGSYVSVFQWIAGAACALAAVAWVVHLPRPEEARRPAPETITTAPAAELAPTQGT